MISKAATLLIFGATIASAQFMPRLIRPTPYDLSVLPDLRSTGCPPAPELAPVICQFMLPNLGHYKPPLIAPSTYVPPLIVEKCDTTHIEIELPAKKPIVIPEAPILPPITIPKFPVPVIVEKPLLPPMPIVEPCETGVISGGSALSIPVAPALSPLEIPAPIRIPQFPLIVEKPLPPPVPIVEPCEPAIISGATAVSIPAAPALPPLEIPALPSIYEQHGGYISGAVINDIDIGYQSMMVPHPPELPGFVMSDFPVRVEPPMPLAPCPEDLPVPVVPIQHLAPIPAAPVLSPVRLPEIPVHVKIPAPVPPMIVEEPCLTGEIVVPHSAPIIVPQPHPKPVFPAPVFAADPCEPSIEPVVKMAEYPYFVRSSPYIPTPVMGPGIIPAHHFRPTQNVALLPSPYVRRV